MLTVFFRTMIVFFAVLIVLRLLGKRQIGEMQPFELAITLIIADLACIPMSDVSIPLLYGIVAILGLFLLHTIIIILNQKNMFCRKLLSGKPVIVINPDGIDFDALKKLNMTISDLEEAIHNAGCFRFEDIQYGILETNGILTVLRKGEDNPSPSLPLVLVSAGKINHSALKVMKKDEKFLEKCIHSLEINSIKNILILTVDNVGTVYVQEKYKKARSSELKIEGGKIW